MENVMNLNEINQKIIELKKRILLAGELVYSI